MDIYSLIKQDHQRVIELFGLLDALEIAAAERTRLFKTLKQELTVHKEAEENTFYAALSDLPEMTDRIEESLEEHVDIEELLEELDDLDSESDAFIAQLRELKEEVEHHVDEEEGVIFPIARELLTPAEADRIAQAMQEERSRLTA
ncbi:MAG: hemerythrin [Rhodospirillales bacterium]|nr:hemerythrin [Rhodospirillales bacterium]